MSILLNKNPTKKTALIRQSFARKLCYFCGTGVPVGTVVLAVMYFAAA